MTTPVKPLVVDLSGTVIGSTDELWDRLAPPCALPPWFGRNLDAWVDALRGGISETLDSHSPLVIRVQPLGLFASDNERGQTFIARCRESGRAKVELADSN
jgi:RNAse (barnase) inhibitor barstar